MEISLQASLLQGSYGKIAKVENNPKASLLNGRLFISPIVPCALIQFGDTQIVLASKKIG